MLISINPLCSGWILGRKEWSDRGVVRHWNRLSRKVAAPGGVSGKGRCGLVGSIVGRWAIGLGDLRGLFQSLWFCDM